MKTGNEPATPTGHNPSGTGLTIREEFAARAMQGFISNHKWTEPIKDDFEEYKDRLVEASVEIANALIKKLYETR